MCTYIHTYICVHIYVSTYIHTYIHTYACFYLYVCTSICPHVLIQGRKIIKQIQNGNLLAYIHIHTYKHTYSTLLHEEQRSPVYVRMNVLRIKYIRKITEAEQFRWSWTYDTGQKRISSLSWKNLNSPKQNKPNELRMANPHWHTTRTALMYVNGECVCM